MLWKHSDCSAREKLIVYDAVIRSKLVYGLESVQINDDLKRKMDAFQLKGLRQILKLTTTFGQQTQGLERTNTNEFVYSQAQEELKRGRREANPRQEICKISEFYEMQRRRLIASIIGGDDSDPIKCITLEPGNFKQIDYGFRRIGGKRNNWWEKGLESIWKVIQQVDGQDINIRYSNFNADNDLHVETLKKALKDGVGLGQARRNSRHPRSSDRGQPAATTSLATSSRAYLYT